jgi:crooked neck
LTCKDVAAARAVYRDCLAVLPHGRPYVFTFGKIWLMAAHLEVRQKDLAAARKILGTAIGP